MTILLDSHILMWFVKGDTRLSMERRQLITNPLNNALFSIAGLWEIAIKSSLNKLEIPSPVRSLVPKNINYLDITVSHISTLHQLPFIHNDPFDRMIISQALTENIFILTDDGLFKDYGVKLL